MTRTGEAIRYSVVSGICFVLGLTLIPAFASYGLHYAIATIFAFVIVVLVGFLLHCYWTFSVERSMAAFSRYLGAMLVNLPLTILLIGAGHDGFGLTIPTATVVASALLFLWNYIAVKWAVRRVPTGDMS